MAQKLTDRTILGSAISPADLVHIVDVSDTTQDASGSSYKTTVNRLIPTLSSCYFVDNQSTTATDLQGQKGNITAPFKTIEYALNLASSGDTVVLLSDCTITDTAGVVNNIFKNGVTLTDMNLGITVTYNGSATGWMYDSNNVSSADCQIYGSLSFINNSTQTANGGAIRILSGSYSNIDITLDTCYSLHRTVILSTDPATTTSICNFYAKNVKLGVTTNVARTEPLCMTLRNLNNNSQPNTYSNITVINLINEYGNAYVPALAKNLYLYDTKRTIVNIDYWYSNSDYSYGVEALNNIDLVLNVNKSLKVGTWVAYQLSRVNNGTTNNNVQYNLGSSKCTGDSSINIENNTIEDIVNFYEIINTSGTEAIRQSGNHIGCILTGNRIEATTGVAIKLNNTLNNTTAFNRMTINCPLIIGNSTNGVIQIASLTGTYTDKGMIVFLNDTKIKNLSTGANADGIKISTDNGNNTFSNFIKSYGQLTYDLASSTTSYPISFGNTTESFNVYVLQMKQNYSIYGYLHATPVSRIMNIDPQGTFPLVGDTNFVVNIDRGNGLEVITANGLSGETKNQVAVKLRDGINTTCGTGTFVYLTDLKNNLIASLSGDTVNVTIDADSNAGNRFRIENASSGNTVVTTTTPSEGVVYDLTQTNFTTADSKLKLVDTNYKTLL